jgi:uncharacterized membrane protein
LVVHFPLALVLIATPLLLAARLVRNDAIASTTAVVGTWNLCLGAVAALFALATGLGAVLDLDVNAAARQAISLHLKWAMFSTLALVLLAVWRGAGTAPASRPSWVFLVVLLAAAAALAVTGYRGGQNVYEFGVGVKRIAVRSGAVMEITFSRRESCRASRTSGRTPRYRGDDLKEFTWQRAICSG